MTFYHDEIGLVHVIVAMLSVIFGSMILVMRKGSAAHKSVGYLYVACMLLTNITAFAIYRLFGGFGLFHLTAAISLVSVIAGMLPAIRKKPNWKVWHFS